MSPLEQMAAAIGCIRTQKPVVHHITNYISINDCANVTLAIGASPIMANDPDEVAEVVSQSSALVLNLGTPNTRMIDSMLIAGKQANKQGIPVIFDPVGVGFTRKRTQTAEQLLNGIRVSAVRGNLAEIQRMAGIFTAMRGLDSLADEKDAPEIVRQASKKMGVLVAATGATDFISDGCAVFRVENGDFMMSQVTGTGCMTTSLVGTCCGAMGASLVAVTAGVMYMGIAGEIARAGLMKGEGTGTFRIRLMDAVSKLTATDILEQGRCICE